MLYLSDLLYVMYKSCGCFFVHAMLKGMFCFPDIKTLYYLFTFPIQAMRFLMKENNGMSKY